MGKFITGPWQRLIDDRLSILELNDHYTHAREMLSTWISNPVPVIDGSAPGVFTSVALKTDSILDCLVQSQSTDQLTADLFVEMCKQIRDVMDRQLKDQLPGGRFADPSPELLAQSKSCSATNISGERVFGLVDSALRRAPNVSVSKLESKTMFSSNKTQVWLTEKTVSDKKVMIEGARQQGAGIRLEEKNQSQT